MASAGSISYIDPSQNTVISYDGKKFGTSFDKKSFIGTRVSYSDVILHSFKVASTISDEELKTNVEIKMYDDAGLDLQKKYKIAYSKKELDFEESILIEAFAIEIDKITEFLSPVLQRSKHIDFLALPFLSFSTLYSNKIIEPKNDLFFYLDENEAFISIYKDGKYLSTKSIIDLNEIVKKLADAGVELSVSELQEHLSEKGLDTTLYERGESVLFNELEAQFSAIFTKINDIVVYNRSVFGFEQIDRIFLSMHSGRIKGIREFIQNFGFEDVEVRDFNLFKEKSDANFFENIVASYIHGKYERKDFKHNLSVFDREPAFYKKESGKIILTAASILLLSFAYVGFLYFENSELQRQNDILEEQYNAMKKNQSRYKKKISAVNKEIKVVLDKKEKTKQRVENISVSMNQLEDIRSSKQAYSSFMLDVNRLLKKHSLATRGILLDGENSISIEIVAPHYKRDNITKFMEDLINGGFIGITTDEIKSDKDIYMSRIEIKR